MKVGFQSLPSNSHVSAKNNHVLSAAKKYKTIPFRVIDHAGIGTLEVGYILYKVPLPSFQAAELAIDHIGIASTAEHQKTLPL
jgi:hypothetical protein